MILSKKKRAAAYAAIHHTITDLRIAMKLNPAQDAQLAQVEHDLWRRLRLALDISDVPRKLSHVNPRDVAILGGDPSL